MFHLSFHKTLLQSDSPTDGIAIYIEPPYILLAMVTALVIIVIFIVKYVKNQLC